MHILDWPLYECKTLQLLSISHHNKIRAPHPTSLLLNSSYTNIAWSFRWKKLLLSLLFQSSRNMIWWWRTCCLAKNLSFRCGPKTGNRQAETLPSFQGRASSLCVHAATRSHLYLLSVLIKPGVAWDATRLKPWWIKLRLFYLYTMNP